MLDFKIPAIIIFLCYLVFLIKTYHQKKPIVHLFQASFVVYISFIIKFTLFPLPITKNTIHIMREVEAEYGAFLHNNFIPLDFLTTGNLLSLGIIGNLALLSFLGMYIPLFSAKLQSIKAVFLIVFLTSLSIETTQFIISLIVGYTYRTFNVDDIILNVSGACIVYVFLKGAIYTYKKYTDIDLFNEFYKLKS